MATVTARDAARVGMDSAWSAIALPDILLNHPGADVALNESALAPGGLAQRRDGQAVEVPHSARGGFVEERDGVSGEEFAIAAGPSQAHAEVLGRIAGREWRDLQPVVETRVQRAVAGSF